MERKKYPGATNLKYVQEELKGSDFVRKCGGWLWSEGERYINKREAN